MAYTLIRQEANLENAMPFFFLRSKTIARTYDKIGIPPERCSLDINKGTLIKIIEVSLRPDDTTNQRNAGLESKETNRVRQEPQAKQESVCNKQETLLPFQYCW